MIFVTGGTGLIGSHLLFELTSSGEKVKALKRKNSNLQQVLKTFSYYTRDAQKLFSQIEWVEGDILDYFGLENLLAGIEEIYHCAAIVSFNKSQRAKMVGNNVNGTANLVNAALANGVKKLCHVSSVAALGTNQNEKAIDEETNWVPGKKATGYSHSKFFSEAEVWRGIEEGLDAVIVNPSIILGPGNWGSGSSRLFKTIWDGMNFYTKGVTGYVDVKDVVKAMLQLTDSNNFEATKNQRYLLNAENLSYRELFSSIADALEKPRPKYYASPLTTNFAWRGAAILSLFSKSLSAISRETASASHSKNLFDGSKITRSIQFEYLPISESIKQTSALLKRDMLSAKKH
ncbi:Nucleoside-diphosphate-sugar epimerase [Mariniphaga anaerophila]|uniref:Nucleoside-diphosphate-sugar epimerase n=1 Tax=Mariniphaga anaerophila TaxID=1484053 RepID=A0A1M4YX14_9BACT|nr:NAD-dependent epimerase/dehydratase family protein [Mariniphaga anaerophila]SHF10270.1 Nucleoside-diphosphate-sugar epimerase [Mariniphaga anaerophila]